MWRIEILVVTAAADGPVVGAVIAAIALDAVEVACTVSAISVGTKHEGMAVVIDPELTALARIEASEIETVVVEFDVIGTVVVDVHASADAG